jgi:hypothetical protein
MKRKQVWLQKPLLNKAEAVAYVVLSLVLLPWTVYLGIKLPAHHVTNHWDLSWVGLDIAIATMLLLTGIFAYRQSRWVIITSSATASFLIVDAWFDVINAWQTEDLVQALILAVLIEVPLAVVSYFVAYRSLRFVKKLR